MKLLQLKQKLNFLIPPHDFKKDFHNELCLINFK